MITPRGYYRNHKHEFHMGLTAFVVVSIAWLVWSIYIPVFTLDSPKQIHISSGQGLSSIATMLEKEGVIRSKLAFMLYVSAQGWERNLKAGDYVIAPGAALNDIASKVAGGKGLSTDIVVFIPEGYNIWEIDKRLADVKLIKEGEFAAAYRSNEGKMFPDTYRFNPKSLLGEIEQKMEDNGKQKTQDLLGHLSPIARDRILTIASIIEKEARAQNDMYLVSGVIANRLRRGMPLAVDAAVSYGACLRKFELNTSKDCKVQDVAVGVEIRIDSPFNTYLRAGLPPRPISNPGLMSIEAALNPKGDYLYYLSTRDGSQTLFSHTGAEHEAKRRQYLGI